MTGIDERLNRVIGELVTITFTDGDKRTGVLEYDMPCEQGWPGSRKYSLYQFGAGRLFFRKSHVKSIEIWKEQEKIK